MITFGQNQMLYTVKNYIEEFPKLVYNDGVKKLFLYIGADLEHLHSIVENAKHKQEVGKRYMTLQDMIDYEKKESFNDGVALGIHALISSLKDLNISTEQILEQLMQKFSLTMEEAKAYLNETTNLM